MTELSDEALQVLDLASAGRDDAIMLVNFLDGATLQVAGKNLLEGQDPRSVARYRSAVRDLHAAGFIEDRAGKGEVFFMTGAGYDMAEHAKLG